LTGQACQPSDEFDSKPILKHDAEKVFRESGLTATQAITLFWKQVGCLSQYGCLCPAQRRVHQQVYLHPHPKELMLRNHVQV
jgi:hypothetical protein